MYNLVLAVGNRADRSRLESSLNSEEWRGEGVVVGRAHREHSHDQVSKPLLASARCCPLSVLRREIHLSKPSIFNCKRHQVRHDGQ